LARVMREVKIPPDVKRRWDLMIITVGIVETANKRRKSIR